MKLNCLNRNAILLLLFISILPNQQIFGFSIEIEPPTTTTLVPYDSVQTENDYIFIWDEFINASKDLPGDDILTFGSSFGPFHNYSEIVHKLNSINQNFPEFIDIFSIGKTYYANDIWCVKITDEANTDLHEKNQILFVAQHHAREQITVENVLYAMDKIIYEASSSNEAILSILKEKEIYIIPSLNIDGASIIHNIPWHRKTLHPFDENQDGVDDTLLNGELIIEAQDLNGDNYIENKMQITDLSLILGYEGYDLENASVLGVDTPGGVDPNRNYDWDFNNSYYSSNDPRSQVFNGNQPFSENCTKALRDFIQENHFQASIALHSGIQAIYYPKIDFNSAKSSSFEEIEEEINFVDEVTAKVSVLTGFPRGPSDHGAGMFSPWMYYTETQIQVAICLETWGNNSAYFQTESTSEQNYRTSIGVWDLFNPPANIVIENSALVYKGLFYIMNLDYEGFLPQNPQNPQDPQNLQESTTISTPGFGSFYILLSFAAIALIVKIKRL